MTEDLATWLLEQISRDGWDHMSDLAVQMLRRILEDHAIVHRDIGAARVRVLRAEALVVPLAGRTSRSATAGRCGCPAWHRGFKAGWHAVREVIGH